MTDAPAARARRRPRLRRIALLLLLLGAVAGAAWWRWPVGLAPLVTVAPVTRGPAVEAVYATGTVEPLHWARVEPLVSARIVEVLVEDGDAVHKGQPLARLDDEDQRSRLAELEARARFLRSDLARQEELARRGVSSPAARERAESELAQVTASIAGARERLDLYILKSPMEGVVLRRDAEMGDAARTTSKQVLFTIGRLTPLRVVLEVDEEDVPRVRACQTTLLTADAFPGRALEGTVERITPLGDPVDKSYRVRVALPDDTPLMIGMTVEANIVVRRDDDALLVPDGAVIDGRVFVPADDGTVQARAVTTGVRGNGRIQIRDGLPPTARIVTDPPAGLTDGAAVRVRGAER